jgi:rSAM-associated Gly-rich repeat protein
MIMAQDRRSLRALTALLPSGILGLSMSLAAADASAAKSSDSPRAKGPPESVALRLEAIRNTVAVVVQVPRDKDQAADDDNVQLAWWGNGWHNGGWGNGGWHNGGWGNGGWHNGGWGNGGWHNGGWHNGWHNW